MSGDTRDKRLIPESGRFPGEGNGNLLQDSCLENPKDRGAWEATIHGVTKRVGHDLATKLPPSTPPPNSLYKETQNIYKI